MSDKESRFFVGELTITDRKRIASYIWKSMVQESAKWPTDINQNEDFNNMTKDFIKFWKTHYDKNAYRQTLIHMHYLIYISDGCTISKKMYILRNLINKES